MPNFKYCMSSCCFVSYRTRDLASHGTKRDDDGVINIIAAADIED